MRGPVACAAAGCMEQRNVARAGLCQQVGAGWLADDNPEVWLPMVKKPHHGAVSVAGRELVDHISFDGWHKRRFVDRRNKNMHRTLNALGERLRQSRRRTSFGGGFGQHPDQTSVRSRGRAFAQLLVPTVRGASCMLPRGQPSNAFDRVSHTRPKSRTGRVAQLPNSSVDEASASSSRNRCRWAM